MKKNRLGIVLAIIYIFLIIGYFIYSFSQIDLNLTLSSNNLYQGFQKQLIQLGYFQRPLSTLVFSILIILLFIIYLFLINSLKKVKSINSFIWVILGLAILILVFSYPALSHDIYNYIFNAKMVLVYHKNPHIDVALQFSHDLWTRFMHNTHTPAPYFYGWTAISLIPSILGLGKLTLNLLTFKLFEIPFFFLTLYFLNKILKVLAPEKRFFRIILLALNPLVLIETFGNGHNDFAMMSLAIMSLWVLIRKENLKTKDILFSIFLLLLSASIKYATIVLLPLYLIFANRKKIDIGSIGAILMFLIIFTRPQDQFQPWYLIWALTFAVFAKNQLMANLLLFFSLSLMLRYAPYLFYGDYSKQMMFSRTLITYIIPAFLLIINLLWSKTSSLKTKN